MTVRINKPAFSIREKLKELERPIGLKGSELMRAETAQEARDLVSAGRKNLIINGAMQVSQRGTSFAVTDNNPFTLDRWQANNSSAYNWGSTITQSTEAPDGFGYSLKVDVTTANALGVSDSAMLRTKIEGQNLQQLAFGTSSAKPISLSFWVRSNKLGTYSVQIVSYTAQRHCVVDYTINSANTWEYKTITLPGETQETIPNDNNIGMEIRFGLGADAADQVAPNSTWVDYSSSALRTSTNQINFFDSTSNEWYLTGVQLEVGKNATDFEHRSYGEELALCQRYYFKIKSEDADNAWYGSGFNYASTTAAGIVNFPVEMRIRPTALEQSGTASDYRVWHGSNTSTNCSSVPTYAGATRTNCRVLFTVASGLTIGQGILLRAANTNSYLAWSAEL